MFVLSARSLRTCTKSKATSCQTEEMTKFLHQLQNLKEKLKVHDLMPKIISENKTSLRHPLFYRCSSTTKLFEEVMCPWANILLEERQMVKSPLDVRFGLSNGGLPVSSAQATRLVLPIRIKKEPCRTMQLTFTIYIFQTAA